jgi:hypothetical protein
MRPRRSPGTISRPIPPLRKRQTYPLHLRCVLLIQCPSGTGLKNQRNKKMKRTLLIGLTGFALSANPVEAACHHYSTWNYPYPQPSCGRAALAARNAPVWYVEITAIPTASSFQGNEDAVAQSKDELNMLLAARKWAKTLQKPWIDDCLRTSTPEQCEVNWEKINK